MNKGTEVPERTEWHNWVLWRGLAEIAEKYVRKGDKLYVEGKIKSRSYDDQAGNKRYVTEIFVDNMEMLSGRTAQGAGHGAAPQAVAPTTVPQQPVKPAGESSEDLPF